MPHTPHSPRDPRGPEGVEITPDTVQRGDVITVGGYACEVVDLRAIPNGGKSLLFHTGEVLTLRGHDSAIIFQLADEVEAAQTTATVEVLAGVKTILADEDSPNRQLRFALLRTAEALGDVLRMAESRGDRLPIPDYEWTAPGTQQDEPKTTDENSGLPHPDNADEEGDGGRGPEPEGLINA